MSGLRQRLLFAGAIAILAATAAWSHFKAGQYPVRCAVVGLARNIEGDPELVVRLSNNTRKVWRVPQHSGSMGDFTPGTAILESPAGRLATNDLSFVSKSRTGFLIPPGGFVEFGAVVHPGFVRARARVGVFQLDDPGPVRRWISNRAPKLGDQIRSAIIWPAAMVDSGGLSPVSPDFN